MAIPQSRVPAPPYRRDGAFPFLGDYSINPAAGETATLNQPLGQALSKINDWAEHERT
jgi:hypothetical protein